MPYKFLVFCCCFLFLTACSTDEKIILEGDRETVFETKKETKKQKQIIIKNSILAKNYPQKGYNSSHIFPSIKVDFEDLESDEILSSFPMSNPPVISENKLFAQSKNGIVKAVNLENTETIWEFTELAKASLKNSGGLAISDKILFATFGNGEIIAFDYDDGKILWRTKTKSAIYGSPTLANGKIFIQTKDNVISIYSQKDGKLVDSQLQNLKNKHPLLKGNSVAIKDNFAVAGTTTGNIIFFKTSGEIYRKQKLYENSSRRKAGVIRDIVALPVIENNTVFVSGMNGTAGAYNLQTGDKKWEVPYGGMTSPIIVENAVFIFTSGGKIVALDKNNGDLIWEKEVNTEDEKYNFPHIINNKIVFFGDDENVLLLDVNSKNENKIDIDCSALISPVFVNNEIFLATKNGNLIRLKKEQ
ncbi:MAG: outer membrane protein assembly factor BamB family protein [Alphaproteobacteria bacterium]|nr:MAG: hypothetical protein B6I23_00275 [Rickettsiaceae bacterium 4572_127]